MTTTPLKEHGPRNKRSDSPLRPPAARSREGTTWAHQGAYLAVIQVVRVRCPSQIWCPRSQA